jgi:hypothetical protein
MADYRSVQTRMWREDDWFQELDVEARLFWIYLFTNPSASPAGIYRLPLRTMAFESGVSYAVAQDLMRRFADEGKARYEDGVVWVVNMRRLQFPTLIDGSKEWQTAVRIQRDIDTIPDRCPLKAQYLAHSGYPTVHEVIENGKPVKRVSIQYPGIGNALSIPHLYSIDTPSVNSNSNSNQTERNETETEPTEITTTLLSEEAPTNGAASLAVGLSSVAVAGLSFLKRIGFQNPDRFIGQVDHTLLAQWGFYYSCLTEAERRAVHNWPALVNDRVRNNKPPRWKNDAQKTRFYQEWSAAHDD